MIELRDLVRDLVGRLPLDLCVPYSRGHREDAFKTFRDSLRGWSGTISVASHGEGRWNRSRALNRAIEQIKMPKRNVMVTDADTLSSPMLLTSICVLCSTGHDMLLGEVFGSPSGLWRGRAGMGGCCVFPRYLWEAIGGFDEEYEVWGQEDNDFVFRAEKFSGRRFEWIEDLIPWVLPPIHLDHPAPDYGVDDIGALMANRNRLAMTKDGTLPIVRPRAKP